MTQDEQNAVIGRMVMERKRLREKEVALVDEVARASRELQSVSGLLANYGQNYSEAFVVPGNAEPFLDAFKLKTLVSDLLATRQELHDLNGRLKQAGID